MKKTCFGQSSKIHLKTLMTDETRALAVSLASVATVIFLLVCARQARSNRRK
jgi:hypothetical protein